MQLNAAHTSRAAAFRAGSLRRASLHTVPIRRCSSVVVRAYQFGDLTRGLVKNAKEKLDKAGQAVTGDEQYKFGDLTKTVLEQARSLDLRELSKEGVQKLKQYRFGSITQELLQSPWGQQVVTHAQAAGRTLSGRPDYELGDFSREMLQKLSGAQDRTSKLLALPGEVDKLKQIVLEQQILINSLVKKEGSVEDAKELLQLTEHHGADDLKPLILEQQEVLDGLLASSDAHAK